MISNMFVESILKSVLGGFAKDIVGKPMRDAQAKIVAGMQSKEMFPPHVTVAVASRDALFRLWKAVVRSGDIADLIRDHMSDSVLMQVATLSPQPQTLDEIVAATRDAALHLLFG